MRVCAVAGAAALAVALSAGLAGGEEAKPVSAYGSCGIKGKHGDRFCFAGDHPVAVYRAFGRARVAYTVCSRKRGEHRHCEHRRTNNPGQRSRTRVDLAGPGRYELAWFEDGEAVDR